MRPYEYTTFNRLKRQHLLDDDCFADLCSYLKKYKGVVHEVTFFNNTLHSAIKKEVYAEFVENLGRMYQLRENLNGFPFPLFPLDILFFKKGTVLRVCPLGI